MNNTSESASRSVNGYLSQQNSIISSSPTTSTPIPSVSSTSNSNLIYNTSNYFISSASNPTSNKKFLLLTCASLNTFYT